MAKQQGEVLIEEVLKTMKAIGIKKTIEVLVQLRSVSSSVIVKDKQEIIINEVLAEFNLSINRLMGSKHDSRYPRMFCYVLLKNHLSYDANEIARVFRRSPNTIYTQMTEFGKLNAKYPNEAKLMERYKKLEQLVLKRIE